MQKYKYVWVPIILAALLFTTGGLNSLLARPAALVARPAAGPSLGSAQSFAVLAGSTATNTGATTVNGDLGVSPGSAVTGFPPGLVTGGTIHSADAVAGQAQNDVTTAYNDLASRACNTDLTGQDLGGLTLVAGVYCFSSSAQLTGALVLDAQGNPNAVFIFKIGSTLTTASNASVRMINGGDACNVFWQVGSSATLGTGTVFIGNILALTSITLTTGARLNGRALARNGAVTMDTNNVSNVCSAPAATSTPTAAPTSTPTAAPTSTATPTTAAVVNTPTPTTAAVVNTPTPTTAAVVNTPTPTTAAVVNTPTPTMAAVVNTPTPTMAANTPTPTMAANTPTPTLVVNTPTPTMAANTPTPTLVANTPTPTMVVNTPTPTMAAVVNTPTPTLVANTPTPTLGVNTPTPTMAPTSTPTPTLVVNTPTPTVAAVVNTSTPTMAPTSTPTPTLVVNTPTPTMAAVVNTPTPTMAPTSTPTPTVAPTSTPTPTMAPTSTPTPTMAPTSAPTTAPTSAPAVAPSPTPTSPTVVGFPSTGGVTALPDEDQSAPLPSLVAPTWPQPLIAQPLTDPDLDLRAGPVPVPLELLIPSLQISAPVLAVGITSKNVMDAPQGSAQDAVWQTAFWYRGGGIPGDPGTATIAGHVDGVRGRPALFTRLKELGAGDLITIHDTRSGLDVRFLVVKTEIYSAQQATDRSVLAQIYGSGPVSGQGPQPAPDGLSHLTLVTCSGDYVNGAYDHRLVVYAVRAPAMPPGHAVENGPAALEQQFAHPLRSCGGIG